MSPECVSLGKIYHHEQAALLQKIADNEPGLSLAQLLFDELDNEHLALCNFSRDTWGRLLYDNCLKGMNDDDRAKLRVITAKGIPCARCGGTLH
jgi:hypothetical protein